MIADICKLSNTQEKLVLLLQCIPGRIQHLLAAVPMNLSRDIAKQHDEGDFGLGRQLADALSILHKLPSAKLQELFPDTISAVLVEDFLWRYDKTQRYS